MRILWVNVGGLWPLNTGGRQRSFHIISELTHRHQVILLTTHGPGDDPEGLVSHLPKIERVLSLPYATSKHDSIRFAMALSRSWFSPLAVNLWRWRIPALRKEVSRLLSPAKIDLCVADFLYAVPNVPFDTPVPVVLFNHNVEHVIWKRLCRIESRWWRRALLEIEWRKLRRYETRTCARAALTVTVSEADRDLLALNAPAARARAIPTGVDTSYFSPNGAGESAARLVFTGSMDWYPNEDAILHFIDAILPRIRREVPTASLTVVGRNPTPRLLTVAGKDGIRVTGTVDDVRPYMAEAAVYVVPLRVGGGTRLKIFEALAMGKAVVATTVGAEGLPLVPGEHFLQADEPADFSRAVVSLLRDAERRHLLGSAGRRLVKERYSWPQVAREFEAHLKEVSKTHAY
jgi:glycosyltransferase involved in cell wall biosynthesis